MRMYEWSETDLMVRDSVRKFIDKEIKPVSDQLESGELPPFDVLRTLFETFGLAEMARTALDRALAKEAGEPLPEGSEDSDSGSGYGGGSSSMSVILNSELAKVSLGLVASMGVSVGLTVGTIRSRGT